MGCYREYAPEPSIIPKRPLNAEGPKANISITIGFNGTTHSSSAPRPGPPIPGPLGLESASLKGKVALVTGAGTLAH